MLFEVLTNNPFAYVYVIADSFDEAAKKTIEYHREEAEKAPKAVTTDDGSLNTYYTKPKQDVEVTEIKLKAKQVIQ